MRFIKGRRAHASRVPVVLAASAAVLATSLAATLPADAATAPGASTSAAHAPIVSRIQGTDRYETAVQVAKKAYPKGAGTVFVASGANFPDALAAGPAAAKLGGPLLLTSPTSLPGSVATELAALAPTKVYVVGGPAAVSAGVESAVKKAAAGAHVSRLDGTDRYATARAVVSKVFPTASKAFIATGANFADALSAAAAAGSAGEPVVLVNGSAADLDKATVTQLTKLGVTDAVIAGGPAAVSTGIQSQLARLLGGASHVTREGGADRYATSALIGRASFTSATTAYFASGAQFPDALAASAVAGAQHAPLFTVQPGCVPNQTGTEVTSLGVSAVRLVGGPQALSARVAALTLCDALFTKTPTPTISGKPEVGQPLTVNPGVWSPTPTHFAFQWLKASSGSKSYTKIAGATAASYTVPNGDAGDTFKVTVTASRSGYLSTGKTSAATAAASPGPELSIVAGVGDSVIPGPALKSPLSPEDVAVDGQGNLYIADYSDLVEKVTPAGDLSVFAGTGDNGRPVAGPATKSRLENVSGVAVDAAGNVYIADQDFVEEVTPGGQLSIVAGNGGTADKPTSGTSALKSTIDATAVAVNSSGDLYIADGDGYVEKVAGGILTVIAGTGNQDSEAPTPNGPATKSAIGTISGMAIDGAGDVYLADSDNGLIEEISNGTLTIVAGGGRLNPASASASATTASLYPLGVAVDSAGDVYIADGDGYVEEVTAAGAFSVVAGVGGQFDEDSIAAGTTVPGPALSTPLAAAGIALDGNGDLYVADQNGFIDEVSGGTLSIVAGLSGAPIPGPATNSPIEANGVGVDAEGDLFLADPYNGVVEKIDTAGNLSVVAGGAPDPNGTGGPVSGQPATDSVLAPTGVALDAAGDLYIADADGYLEKVSGGTLTVVAGDGEQGVKPTNGAAALTSAITPMAIAVDRSGNVYLADETGYVEKVTTAGKLTVVAGNGSSLLTVDSGTGTYSALRAHSLLPAQTERKTSSAFRTDAGQINYAIIGGDGPDAPTPGLATKSALGFLGGIAVDSAGNLYLADEENDVVEKVTASTDQLSIAVDGNEKDIELASVAIDGSNNLYLSDESGFIDKVSPKGAFSTIAGDGDQAAPTPGLALKSALGPEALTVDGSGNVYAIDWSGYLVKIVQ